MAHLHLPAEHDESDREMARALAAILSSDDLYVTWTSASGRARPVIPTACETRRRRRGLKRLLGVLSPRRAG